MPVRESGFERISDMASADIEELGLIEGTTDPTHEYGSTSPGGSQHEYGSFAPVGDLQASINTTSSGKKVDFVLVFEKATEDENENQERDGIRQEFEKNLMKDGLELERTEGTLPGCENVVFVLIHAPWDVLCRYAEKMMIRVPIREPDKKPEQKRIAKFFHFLWRPFELESDVPEKERRYITHFFTRNKMSSFLIKDQDSFFSDNDRSRIVNFILQGAKFSSELEDFGVDRLINKEVYIDAYRLHDGPVEGEQGQPPENDRQRLRRDWASFRRWYKYQPLNAIKNYLGIRVGLYFAWLGTYSFMLVFAAIVGLLCFISGLVTVNSFTPALEICDKNNTETFYMCPLCDKVCSFWSLTKSCLYARVTHLFDHEGTVFFAIFMSLWATVFLEVWKRQQISLAYEWDMLQFEEDIQPPRPAYVAKVKETRPNPVTGKMEPHLPRLTQLKRSACSASIIVTMVLLVIAAVAGVILYRAAMIAALSATTDQQIQLNARIITSTSASALNLVAITILSKVYGKLAILLTDWENPRTSNEYRDNMTIKMFMFEFVNYYSSLFYIAFFKSGLIVGTPGRYTRVRGDRLEGCDPNGCLVELFIQLTVIMVGKQLFSAFTEYAIPSLTKWWKKRKQGNLDRQAADDTLVRWEAEYLLNPEPDFRMFHQYLDMVIQFGFVTMFVAAFPLAPLFALINNALELRIDAVNFVVNFRRPVAERAQTIGVWYDILLALSRISVLINSFVIAFTSEFITRQVCKYAYSLDGSLTGYVDNSLSYYNVSDMSLGERPLNPYKNLDFNATFCRYKGYRELEKPYRFSRQFFLVTTARLAFVIVFQYFVFFTVGVLAWIIPDVPRSLDIKIKKENYIAKERLAASDAVEE